MYEILTVSTIQENVKTKHPQLLYESKLYRILQGGSNEILNFKPILISESLNYD